LNTALRTLGDNPWAGTTVVSVQMAIATNITRRNRRRRTDRATPSSNTLISPILEYRQAPNVKHQRARATASRGKDDLSLRALRCMR
jgi:hypothetical protein